MASVETLPTCTVVAVMPVWSLKALAGMVRPTLAPVVPVLAGVVVVVDDELVELQATAVGGHQQRPAPVRPCASSMMQNPRLPLDLGAVATVPDLPGSQPIRICDSTSETRLCV